MHPVTSRFPSSTFHTADFIWQLYYLYQDLLILYLSVANSHITLHANMQLIQLFTSRSFGAPSILGPGADAGIASFVAVSSFTTLSQLLVFTFCILLFIEFLRVVN